MFERDFFEKIRRMAEDIEKKTMEGASEPKEEERCSHVRARRIRALQEVSGTQEVKETLETEYVYIEKPRELIFCMQIPGAGKEGVEVKRRGRAIEIVARREDRKAYFSTFELPPGAIPEERVLRVRKGLLIMTIPRRKSRS